MRLTCLVLKRRTLLTGFLPAFAGGKPADVRYTELAHPKTHFQPPAYGSRQDWERRRLHLRRQVLGAAGLLPFPVRNPVQAQIVRQTRHEEYATEAVLLETLPGYFVGGTIYRPLDTTVRRPAILIPHGHWKRGRIENIPSYSVPALGINLALQGYVAFAWDMAGYNDTRQTPHDFGGWREQLWGFSPMGLQLWNSIRALDYVISRPDVAPQRIGCTGASGGATQTILLSAVDLRITCSAPVNMISATYQGADPCEEAPNLRLGTNNVEIAAMMAPRPMLMVSCTGDWTRNTPVSEFPAVKGIYSLYGRAESVLNAHFEAEHNYDARTREAAYRFFSKYLLAKTDAGFRDREIGAIDTRELLCHTPEVDPLKGVMRYDDLFAQWISVSRRQNARPVPRLASRAALLAACGAEWPARVGVSNFGERLLLTRTGVNDRLPALWLRGRGTPALIIHPEGSEAASATPEMKALRAAGRPVLAPDVFQTGLARESRQTGGRWYLSYNRTDDANRLQDILTALRWIRSQTQDEPELVGLERAAIWVVFAAAVAPGSVSVVADLSKCTGLDEEMRECFFVPCIQRAGGLSTALRLVPKIRSEL